MHIKIRSCYQQFLRENKPLFRALAAITDEPYTVLHRLLKLPICALRLVKRGIGANAPGMTASTLHVFLKSSHGQMPDFKLSRGEIDDVAAYILSMRTR